MKNIWRIFPILLITFILPAHPVRQTQAAFPNPFLVADLNTVRQHSHPYPFLSAGAASYFFTYNYSSNPSNENLPRLYQTDGTPQGTRVMKFMDPGSPGDEPLSALSALFGGWLFFSAYDPENGYAVWRTNSSPENTILVTREGSSGASIPFTFQVFQEKLYFAGESGIWYLETPTGQPQPLVETTTGASTTQMMDLDDRLVFSWVDPQHGTELWTSDGTPAGTHILEDIFAGSGSSSPSLGLVFQNTLYFKAQSYLEGEALWSYRPAQNQLTRLLTLENMGTQPPLMTTMGDWVYFFAYDWANGKIFYRTNGLEVQQVIKLSGSNTQANMLGTLTRDSQSRVLFLTNDPDNEGGLYSSNGTKEGTIRLAGPLSYSSGSTTYMNGRFYFGAQDKTHGVELWQTDGTAAGTGLVKDIYPGPEGSLPNVFGPCGSRVCFFADDGVHGLEPWSSDGTPAGTQMLVDANPQSDNADLYRIQPAGGRLYFIARDGTHHNLYRAAPAAAGAELLHQNVDPYDDNGVMAVIDDQLFYLEDQGEDGYNLWRVAGATSQPTLVKELGKMDGNPAIEHIQALNQAVYIPFGNHLWTSDGAPDNTRVLYDLANPINYLTAFDNRLVFGAYNPTGWTILYASDGTAPTPTTLRNIAGQIVNSAQAGQNLFLNLSTGPDTHQLWQIDAATLTPQQVAAPACLGNFGILSRLTGVGDTLFFLNLSADQTQMTLLETRGAQEGAECIWSANLAPDTAAWSDSPMAVFQGKIFFEMPGPDGRRQLMMSDGAAEGTQIFPGMGLPATMFQTVDDPLTGPGGLFFQAATQANGSELWFWDGTQSPHLITDLNPGIASSSPKILLAENDRLYFTANNGLSGRELWTLDTTQMPTVR